MTQAAAPEAITQLCETAPLGIALVDSTLRFVWVNDALCGILGYSRGEFLKLRLEDISHPDHKDAGTRRRLLRGEISHITVEKRQITKKGKEKWVRVNACVFRTGSSADRYGALFVEDISERVKLERDLARRSSDALAVLSTLTSRELELMQLVAAGHTFNQIATSLFLSKRTIESHASAVYRKLGVKGREDAVRKLAELQRLTDVRTIFSATSLMSSSHAGD